MEEIIYSLSVIYFTLIISSAVLAKLLCPILLKHGSISLKTEFLSKTNRFNNHFYVQKNFFPIFYAIGIFIKIFFNNNSYFLIHLIRRFVESFFLFRYSIDSKMNIFHFLLGISYYVVISSYIFSKKNIFIPNSFIIFNILQFFAHYQIFRKKRFRSFYIHYLCELGIYYSLYWGNKKDLILFLNFIWVLTFFLIEIL